MKPTNVAIIGSGNIGTDLMMKVLRTSSALKLSAMAGIDPASEGLARAAQLGVPTTHEGLPGLIALAAWDAIDLLFDATSARAHVANDALIRSFPDKRIIDLTPAAIGPYVVPSVNLDLHADVQNLNLVTCGGQATIPIVAAVSQVAPVYYGEIVSAIASKSAGPGTRANIDEFTRTTARGIEQVGGAERGKAIIILNPAEPPLVMRNTVFTLSAPADRDAVRAGIERMVGEVQQYVPGYRLHQDVQFEDVPPDRPVLIAGLGYRHGLKTTVFLQVRGAGHYLPPYAGNLDIMTSAALATGEKLARLVAASA